MSTGISKQIVEVKRIALKLDAHITQLLDDKANSSALHRIDFLEILKDMLQRIKDFLGQLGSIIILTKEERNGSVFEYKTTVKVSGDIENSFPSTVTPTIWDRHNAMVDETIKARKNALLKIIEMLGEILKLGD